MITRSSPIRLSARPLGALALLGLLIAGGTVPKVRRANALESGLAADSAAGLAVRVIAARRAPADIPLALSGTVEALHSAEIYARTNGYVRRWHADLGSRVKAGDVLADIETPDLDRELDQARADRDRQRSALSLAQRNLVRWEALASENAVSKLEVDERRTAFEDATGALAAAEANARRLGTLQGFARLVSPFSGIITARNLDVGTLVAPGTAPGGHGLYTVTQIDTVRVMVDIPQAAVSDVRLGLSADVAVRELGSRVFKGKVSRTANALDPASRTQRVEVWVPNSEGTLLPGMYGEVRFQLTRRTPPVVVPASTIVVRTEGAQVAVLGPDGAVHYKTVTLGRDYGPQVEILNGVSEGDQLVLSPSDEVLDGSRAHAVANPEDTER